MRRWLAEEASGIEKVVVCRRCVTILRKDSGTDGINVRCKDIRRWLEICPGHEGERVEGVQRVSHGSDSDSDEVVRLDEACEPRLIVE
jgi:hypothetical protein